MKTAAVLVCLAHLLAIAYSAPVDNPGVQKRSIEKAARAHPHAVGEKALHELESLEKRVKANHQLVNDPGFREQAKKALGLVKKRASNMDASQRKKVAREVAKILGKMEAQMVYQKLHK
ncbi:uncharacterized protein LOC144873731 [Branchiostoma floridae x Branchiostoma japonicum]